MAQSGDLIRDTEIERLMRSYEDPILKAAGIDSASIKMYLLDDPSINAAAAISPDPAEGEVIVVNAGTFLQLDTPNQMIGVLAHETGHIAGGHLTRDREAMNKAMIPMLIGMALGVAAMIAGGGQAGMAVMGLGEQAAMSQFNQFSRAQEGTADQMGQKFLLATHQSGRGMLEVFQKFAREEGRYKIEPMYLDHPLSRERIDLLQQLVDKSPYKDVKIRRRRFTNSSSCRPSSRAISTMSIPCCSATRRRTSVSPHDMRAQWLISASPTWPKRLPKSTRW